MTKLCKHSLQNKERQLKNETSLFILSSVQVNQNGTTCEWMTHVHVAQGLLNAVFGQGDAYVPVLIFNSA